jgi:hypothetical protein
MNPVLPPGDAPHDPAIKEIDPLAFALNKVRIQLVWIDEHRAGFEANRISNPEIAARELHYLAHATVEARVYLDRLAELLLSGYSIDPNKRLPTDLQRFKDSIGESRTDR